MAKDRKNEELIQRIIDESYVLMTEQGLARTKMSEIASNVGVTRRTLYAYFPHKNAIIIAVVTHLYHGFEKDFITNYESCENNSEKLALWIRKYLESSQKNIEYSNFFELFQDYLKTCDAEEKQYFKEVSMEMENRVFSELKEIFDNGVETKEFSFDANEYKLPMFLLFNNILKFVSLMKTQNKSFGNQKAIDQFVQMTINMISR